MYSPLGAGHVQPIILRQVIVYHVINNVFHVSPQEKLEGIGEAMESGNSDQPTLLQNADTGFR
jgi:hypothetical protein